MTANERDAGARQPGQPLAGGGADDAAARSYLSAHPALKHGGGGSKALWLGELLAPVLPGDPNARILEIGPGHGEALRLLRDRGGYRQIDAIDNSPEVIAACRDLPGVTAALVEDATAWLAARAQAYDLVLLYHVVEHFPPDAVPPLLTAVRLALKPGGVVVVGVPNAAAPIIGPEQQAFDFTHRTAFSPWSLEQVLRMSGFARIEVHPVWPPRAGLARAVQRLLQKTVIALLRAYLRLFTGEPRPVLTHSMVAYAWA